MIEEQLIRKIGGTGKAETEMGQRMTKRRSQRMARMYTNILRKSKMLFIRVNSRNSLIKEGKPNA